MNTRKGRMPLSEESWKIYESESASADAFVIEEDTRPMQVFREKAKPIFQPIPKVRKVSNPNWLVTWLAVSGGASAIATAILYFAVTAEKAVASPVIQNAVDIVTPIAPVIVEQLPKIPYYLPLIGGS